MAEQIKLRVPSKPAAEYVEHGNYNAVLKPKSVIAVSDRRFADWLVLEFGLAEVGGKTAVTETEDEPGDSNEEPLADEDEPAKAETEETDGGIE